MQFYYIYIYVYTYLINAAAGHITQCQSTDCRLVTLALRHIDAPPHIRHRFTEPKFRTEFLRGFFETFLRLGSSMTFSYYSHTLTIRYKPLAHSTYGQNNGLVTWATRGQVIPLLTPNMVHCRFFIVTTKYTVLWTPFTWKKNAVTLAYLHGTQMSK